MKIFVTGATGFIGSSLVKSLSKENIEVVAASRSKGVDLTNWDTLKDLEPCDMVIHLAANTFVPDSFENPRTFYFNNVNATINALELARKWDVRLIFLSSFLYGKPAYVPVDEKHNITPHNPYANTKWVSEEICRGYSKDFDVPVVSFRLFNVYGPSQKGSFLIPEILQQAATGKVVLKDPRPKRDYIHITDIVRAIMTAVTGEWEGFNVYNLGTGRSHSVEEVVDLIRQYGGYEFEVTYTHEYRKGEVLDSVADISKVKQELYWEPTIPLKDGVKTLNYQ